MIYEVGEGFYIDLNRITAVTRVERGSTVFGEPIAVIAALGAMSNDASWFYVYCQLHEKPIVIAKMFDDDGTVERWRKNLLIVWEKEKLKGGGFK